MKSLLKGEKKNCFLYEVVKMVMVLKYTWFPLKFWTQKFDKEIICLKI